LGPPSLRRTDRATEQIRCLVEKAIRAQSPALLGDRADVPDRIGIEALIKQSPEGALALKWTTT